MKKLGDAIGRMDMAGHMGCGENSEADVSLPPHTPLSLLKINSLSLKGGTCPPPIIPPPPSTPKRERESFLEMSFEEVLESAKELGIPDWYADFWFKSMSAKGWKMASGEPIKNWRALMHTWWMRSSDKQKAQIEAAYLAEQKSAAEDLDDPEPKIEVTRDHWYECQRTCAYFKKGKCLWGARHPVGDEGKLTPSLAKRLTLTRSLASRGAGTSNEKLLKRPKESGGVSRSTLLASELNLRGRSAAVRAWLAWLSRAKARSIRKEAAMKS